MTNENSNCIFCKIVKGEIPAVKIWEDKNYFIMLDSHPINPGHTLVIPKKHDEYIFDLNDREYVELILKAKTVAKTLKEKLKPKRIGIAVEGFGVPHVHIHLVPLNKGNELNPERAKHMDENKLKLMAEKITGK
ncbi:MAG: HIT family protein [Candidatus Pacearchaeota archaeon]|nr:HIT family protein [Candidatus Pacearchaeota archaeon]